MSIDQSGDQKIIPVTPPELSSIGSIDGGRFYKHQIFNDLYRRVIIRTNCLKRLMEDQSSEVILRNEKRMPGGSC